MNTFILDSNLSTSHTDGKANMAHVAVQLFVGLDQLVDSCYDKVMAFFTYSEVSKVLTIGTGGSPTVDKIDDKDPKDSSRNNKVSEADVTLNLEHSDIHRVWNANFMF